MQWRVRADQTFNDMMEVSGEAFSTRNWASIDCSWNLPSQVSVDGGVNTGIAWAEGWSVLTSGPDVIGEQGVVLRGHLDGIKKIDSN